MDQIFRLEAEKIQYKNSRMFDEDVVTYEEHGVTSSQVEHSRRTKNRKNKSAIDQADGTIASSQTEVPRHNSIFRYRKRTYEVRLITF